MFLKLGSINGGSLDDKHKDEIEIASFSWGETAPTLPAGGSGKSAPGDFHFTKDVDVASVPLFLACARGDLIGGGTLSVRRAGGSRLEYLHIAFGPLHISSYQVGSAHGQENASEQFSLAVGRVTMSYTPQRPDGSAGTPISGGFDFVKHVQA
jgi:type VI secretion system secreted protein Hcp